jgi:hypothetical protein
MFRKKIKNNALDSFNVILSESAVDGVYDCIIIQSGVTTSANTYASIAGKQVPVKKLYSEPCLVEAVNSKLFEGVPALLRDEDKHLLGQNTGINSIIGYYKNVVWDPILKAVKGKFNFKAGEGYEFLKQKFAEAIQSGKNIGLSIVAWGDWTIEKIGNEFIATVDKITNVQSIDPCAIGNAGGKLVSLIESEFTNNKFFTNILNGENKVNPELKLKIFDICNSAMLLSEGATVASVNDDDLVQTFFEYAITLMNSPTLTEAVRTKLTEIKPQLEEFTKVKSALLAELLKKPLTTPIPTPAPAPTPNLAESNNQNTEIQKLLDEAKKVLCKSILKEKLAESKLPQPTKNLIAEEYKDKIFESSDLDTVLARHQKVLAELNPAYINNQGNDIRLGLDAVDKATKQLEYILMSSQRRMRLTEAERKAFDDAGVDKKMFSIKEWYRAFTGDVNVSGVNTGRGLLAESIVTTGFANALASTINRLAVAEYIMLPWDDWRKVCSVIGPVSDFRNNERVRWGGYGSLPTVLQSGTYSALTTPNDEKATFAVTKKGGTEDITLEAIKNDDVGLIASIPTRLGKAAKITLYEFVMNLITGNGAIYDTKALFHIDHANLMNSALDATSYSDARNRLKNQTEKDSLKKLRIPPKYLLIADGTANEKVAYDLTTRAWNKANDVSDFHQTFGVKPIPVITADDDDWFLVGDPNFVPTIEIGFLDGQEEPEIFTQDMPNVGSFFTNDKITLKIRHIYNGCVLDYRGFAGSIV